MLPHKLNFQSFRYNILVHRLKFCSLLNQNCTLSRHIQGCKLHFLINLNCSLRGILCKFQDHNSKRPHYNLNYNFDLFQYPHLYKFYMKAHIGHNLLNRSHNSLCCSFHHSAHHQDFLDCSHLCRGNFKNSLNFLYQLPRFYERWHHNYSMKSCILDCIHHLLSE
ncbi:unnamed protein product [Blepharisma stoltei]|uniref:Uncharacterized protein n=1 Tax=Blepharisma stoltei TaxID=1481888 RepID=A0AAU9JCS4_9CILI|nr:unnamed protein product [Blepharisma stoltei]